MCHHNNTFPYCVNQDVFEAPREPTREEIADWRLYECGSCGKWISLLPAGMNLEEAKRYFGENKSD